MKRLPATTAIIIALTFTAHAQRTLYWAGGSTNRTNGAKMPETAAELSGVWDATTRNWSVDPQGSEYVAWGGGGPDAVAVFTPFPTASTIATVELRTDATLNKMFVRHDHPATSGQWQRYHFSADQKRVLTVAGESPEIFLSTGDNGRTMRLDPPLELAAQNGFVKSGNGELELQCNADAVRGTVIIHGAGNYGGIKIYNNTAGTIKGSMNGVTLFQVNPAALFVVQLVPTANLLQNVLNDNAEIRLAHNAHFQPRGGNGIERFGRLALDASGTLHLNGNSTSSRAARSAGRTSRSRPAPRSAARAAPRATSSSAAGRSAPARA